MNKPSSESKVPALTKRERGLLGVVFMLTFIQSLSIGFCQNGILILLAEKGIKSSVIGLFMFLKAPSACKFLLGPLIDSYYIQKIGRRKTYFIPCEILLGLLYIYFSHNLEHFILHVEISKIFWTCLSIC